MYVNIFLSDRNLQVRNNRKNSVLPLPIHTVFQVLNMHGILYFRIRNYQNCCLMMNCCFLCYWNCLNSSCCCLYYYWSCLNYWSCQNYYSLLYYSEMLPEVVSVFPLMLSSDALPLLSLPSLPLPESVNQDLLLLPVLNQSELSD